MDFYSRHIEKNENFVQLFCRIVAAKFGVDISMEQKNGRRSVVA